MKESVQNEIRKEVKTYTYNADSMMRKTFAEDIKNFDIVKLASEFRTRLPISMSILDSLCQPFIESSMKTYEALEPVLASVMAKCLGILSDRNSLYRYVISTVLLAGGCTQATTNQFAKLYDAMSLRARDQKQLEFVDLFEKEFDLWRNTIYSTLSHLPQITFDNVDKYVKRRHSDKATPNTMKHMVQAIVYKDNVPTVPYQPPPLNTISAESLLPQQADIDMLEDEFANIVCDIWFTYFTKDNPNPTPYVHQFSNFTDQKTSKVINTFV